MGTEACVALKEKSVGESFFKSISNGTCWGGWRNDVGADFPGHLLQWSKFLQIIWFMKFSRKNSVNLFIYQVKLCDKVVEVLVAGVHMRFRT